MANKYFRTETIDYATGEIISKTSKIKITDEPPYVKFYLKTLCMMNSVPQGHNSILYYLLSNITYASQGEKHGGQIIVVNKYIKELMCAELGIAEITIKKALASFVANGLFKRVARGTYQANPEFFGKGDWKDISNIIATIDFGNGTVNPTFKRNS